MRKLLPHVCIVFAIYFCINGCGGGGGGNSGTGGGGGIVLSQRLAVMQAINLKYQTLNGTDLNANNQTLLTFVRTRSEFSESGISVTGGVWARFKDGRMLIVSNNREPSAASKAQMPTRSRLASELPAVGSNTALFVNSDAFDTSYINAIGSALQTSGYAGKLGDLTLDNLRLVQNCGILYIDCHAGDILAGDHKTVMYGLQTQSTVADTIDSDLASDFVDDSVGYMLAPGPLSLSNHLLGAKFVLTNNYFITANFVRKHMSFSANSMVFINSCGSDSPVAQDFRQSFFDKQASLYAGWTKRVETHDAAQTAGYLFDRLLGEQNAATTFHPEDPPQRPFDILAVADWMDNTPRPGALNLATLLTSWVVYNPLFPPDSSFFAKLQFTANPKDAQSGNGGLLAPSISGLNVFQGPGPHQQLAIQGKFGSKPGTVTVGGHDTTIVSWTGNASFPGAIICTLPDHGSPGDAGDVQVTVNGHKSNMARLTEWAITLKNAEKFNYTDTIQVTDQNGVGTDTYSGTQEIDSDLKLWIRADVSSARSSPGEKEPFKLSGGIMTQSLRGVFYDGQFVDWKGSGTETVKFHRVDHFGINHDWTSTVDFGGKKGSSPIPFTGSDSRAVGALLNGQYDSTKKALTFSIEFTAQDALVIVPTGTFAVDHGAYNLQVDADLELKVDATSGTISGGTGNGRTEHIFGYTGTNTITWATTGPVGGTEPVATNARSTRPLKPSPSAGSTTRQAARFTTPVRH